MQEAKKACGYELDAWQRIVEACELTVYGISRRYDIASTSLIGWLSGEVVPRDKSKKRMEELLMKLEKTKRIPFHPAWGYATDAQVRRLKESIPPQERERILKQIEKQTKLGGKID